MNGFDILTIIKVDYYSQYEIKGLQLNLKISIVKGDRTKLHILIGIMFIVVTATIYSIGRKILNKEFNLEIPIIPERYYDNRQLTVIQAILTIFSFTVSIVIFQLIEEYLTSR